ncbi:ABC transporter ATP-binding protein [Anaerocolumna sp. AGMB13025]|uniref:ABC transporter ATP-binding protein n=1 Tax=Anaerocolumna sp. AGMB13025 TaxID=3039116 RepID=UPI00241EF566|nr:ABC transporter ATP-binding protein [Anaerocolumna sp. AGMB13025]WFR56319.1 ABC transporter ATP-binding protein [Anaerocolumna sp. AGMB13025]
MKNENAVEVKNVKKKFKVYFDKGSSLKEKVLFKNRNRYEVRWVLNGISFEVKKGEAIGIIGHNGCGKSTTLKLLTRIMYPDDGTIEIKGRVSSLIELGAGFHPDMSGRENIYTNASIFGLTRKEIDSRINDIIEFSELEEFLDNPVRTYSSGMYMRLAFSIAINVDADVLLIDEILAVGDANFQAKCLNKLREIKSRGTTIVIVSHSMTQIEQICNRCIWINKGEIYKEGSPSDIVYQYLDYMGEQNKGFQKTVDLEVKNDGIQSNNAMNDQKEQLITSVAKNDDIVDSINKDQIAKIVQVELLHKDGKSDTRFKTGEPVTLRISYKAKPHYLDQPIIGLKLYRNDNINSFGTNTQNEHVKVQLYEQGFFYCHFEKFNLIAGEYILDIAIRSQEMFAYDYISHAAQFVIYNSIYEEGIVHLDHYWEFKSDVDIE